MTRTEIRWVLLPFEILLGFVLVGSAAVLAAGLFYLWYEPVGGFFSAIAVVAVAYIRAPAWPVMAALVAYSVGCAVAHSMLWESSFYPEHYSNAYQPKNLPFCVTFAGGALALVAVTVHALLKRRSTSNTSLERTRER
jgi:hypothetical protein